ncbi:hypothetical protein [Thermasporomyces composti]|nr:hypothetical protein [Thermasporomyces composti]
MSANGERRRVGRPVRAAATAVVAPFARRVAGGRAAGNLAPTPALLRVGVWATGCVALLLAVPPSWAGRSTTLLAVVVAAVVPAAAPGSWTVLALELVAAGGWLLRTWDASVPWPPLLGLAAALYLHHVSAAFAAALPGDARVGAGALRRPIARATGVLTVTGVLGALALTVQERIDRASTVAVPVIGIVLAVVVAGYLALVWRRDPP